MKRIATALLLLSTLLLLAPSAQAQDAPSGTIGSPAGDGSFKVTFPASAPVAPRDVFNVTRDGQVVGQVMILLVPNQGMVAVQMQGTVKPGDQLVFVRHDTVPVAAPSPTPPPAQADPSAQPPQGGPPPVYGTPPPYNTGSYGYNECNTSFPCEPISDGVFSAGVVGYPGVYGGRVYGTYAYPHTGAYTGTWGHPSAAAVDDAHMAGVRAASGVRR